MAKTKISSKDFLDLLDEQSDQPSPALGTLTSPKRAMDRLGSERAPETGNKPATNREQSDNKPATKLTTNREQTGNKASGRTDAQTETGNKVGTEPATLSATKRQQTENKPATTGVFSSLVGLQRAIMVFLYDACKTARGRATDALSLEHIGSCLGTSAGSAKTTLQRLEDKGCVLRIAFKNGRGGWSKYELPESIFREMLQLETENKLATKWQHTGNKVGTEPATEPATSIPSSSSSIELENFKTTTTGDPQLFDDAKVQLSPDWLAVDASPLSEIGFSQTHLVQLAKQVKLSAAEVNASIEFFAFDLKRNGKGRELKGPPLNFFMGILRKGVPYAPPENFERPADEARRRTREILERKERERQAEEQRIRDLEFAEWRRGVAIDEIVGLLPAWAQKPGPIQDNALRAHFDAKVWPEMQVAAAGSDEWERLAIQKEIEQSLTVATQEGQIQEFDVGAS
jgi:hypothetical protein